MRRLGCLTPFGLGAGLVAVLGVALVALLTGGTMFNPGPLSAHAKPGVTYGGVSSHAALAGDCGACHSSPLDTNGMDAHCLNCHTDIQAQQADPSALHGIIPASQSCRSCHTEHRGAAASLTNTALENFDHAALGFALTAHQTTAAGQPFGCADCHPGLAETPHPPGAYAFTASLCQDCHAGYQADFVTRHVADFGTNCVACHDGVDRYSGFDHNKLTFPLEGKHATATCISCHKQASTPAEFKGISTTCVGCHLDSDVHKGALGTDCASCHNASSWGEAVFDHSKTAFPLTGAHIKTACASCHGNHFYKGTPKTCVDCHADPKEHLGQFGTDCAACHSTDTWKGATFDHSKTAFPLNGAHVKVVCTKCHVNNVYKGTPKACVSCHVDPHKGQFGNNCNTCHSTSRWTGAVFKHNYFPMNHGSRGNSPCTTCHTNSNNYKSYTCYGCHAHTPAGIAATHRGEVSGNLDNCLRCH